MSALTTSSAMSSFTAQLFPELTKPENMFATSLKANRFVVFETYRYDDGSTGHVGVAIRDMKEVKGTVKGSGTRQYLLSRNEAVTYFNANALRLAKQGIILTVSPVERLKAIKSNWQEIQLLSLEGTMHDSEKKNPTAFIETGTHPATKMIAAAPAVEAKPKRTRKPAAAK